MHDDRDLLDQALSWTGSFNLAFLPLVLSNDILNNIACPCSPLRGDLSPGLASAYRSTPPSEDDYATKTARWLSGGANASKVAVRYRTTVV